MQMVNKSPKASEYMPAWTLYPPEVPVYGGFRQIWGDFLKSAYLLACLHRCFYPPEVPVYGGFPKIWGDSLKSLAMYASQERVVPKRSRCRPSAKILTFGA